MNIKNIRILNYRAFKDSDTINLNNFNCLIGQNDSGKSTIISALEWFFSSKELGEYDVNVDLPKDFYVFNSDAFFIEIIFSDIYFSVDNSLFNNYTKYSFKADSDFLKQIELCIRKDKKSNYTIKIYCKDRSDYIEDCNSFSQIEDMFQQLYENYCNNIFTRIIRNKKVFECFEFFSTIKTILKIPIFQKFTPSCSLKEYLNMLFKVRLFAKNLDTDLSTIKSTITSDINSKLSDSQQCYFDSLTTNIDFFTNDNDLMFHISNSHLNIIPLCNRGEGVQCKIKNLVCRFIAESVSDGNDYHFIVAFEEPETHLHPNAQKEMFETIKELCENNNCQVLMTTHSPYIVKELSKDKSNIIVVKRNEKEHKSYISTLDERVLPYESMNEINYIAFDQPSIEYHIELFGFIHNKLIDKYENDSDFKTDWDSSIIALDKNGVLVKVGVSTIKGVDIWLEVKSGARKYNWYETKSFTKEKRTLPYCVRNNIDHPLTKDDTNNINKHRAFVNNSKFEKYIQQSIEIMRNAIINNPNVFT